MYSFLVCSLLTHCFPLVVVLFVEAFLKVNSMRTLANCNPSGGVRCLPLFVEISVRFWRSRDAQIASSVSKATEASITDYLDLNH
jgi:hypothetical protein